jgi:phosphoribosylaminoimidazolecarboxamide formyltransferase / IMP cyclohydrolase
MIRRALISVSDKTGIVEFAKRLESKGIEIISTGGTFRALTDAGIGAVSIDDVTGFPEMLDGRVKTLHPAIHGGLLALRGNPDHMTTIAEHGIEPIDLVVVNLYPFEATVERGAALEECIEQIDIGGPSMLRSAAKNFGSVTVVCDPRDYNRVWAEIEERGDTTEETRAALALGVFQKTSTYDAAVSAYLASGGKSDTRILPQSFNITLRKEQDLRYGENPHQAAALYGGFFETFEKLHGKELSFNNIVDIQAAAALAGEFDEPAAAIIKHTNPCGCAIGSSLLEAYGDALITDPVSAYGGVTVFNGIVNARLAEKLNEIFSEVIIAPDFESQALELLKKKRDRRLMRLISPLSGTALYDIKAVANGYLCQTTDRIVEDPAGWKVVSKRAPSPAEMKALAFAWKVVKHVKSNAIVYTDSKRTLGVGAGQMSRVDSSAIAALKALNAGLSLEGSVVASDAYFPFADGLLEAIRAGATAAIEPGGSVRDEEVIAAADEHSIALLFTGIRHFKH